ncbi:hypothetical protein BGZ61DRAFT_450152 [Ilyonectria robusta]|uniref:uncharacterized protein n=1 Tax=Ilyonectria robusta TaxID=1079257 RepID=UPI001E8D34A6|nr:uncharacterized protein BGZ61DRAFT_450152 [Ilyonectria robusta]KAH8706581.1 hypothetical protein BGZ61DRAFT_450152 [Ilyonectria robusta]
MSQLCGEAWKGLMGSRPSDAGGILLSHPWEKYDSHGGGRSGNVEENSVDDHQRVKPKSSLLAARVADLSDGSSRNPSGGEDSCKSALVVNLVGSTVHIEGAMVATKGWWLALRTILAGRLFTGHWLFGLGCRTATNEVTELVQEEAKGCTASTLGGLILPPLGIPFWGGVHTAPGPCT